MLRRQQQLQSGTTSPYSDYHRARGSPKSKPSGQCSGTANLLDRTLPFTNVSSNYPNSQIIKDFVSYKKYTCSLLKQTDILKRFSKWSTKILIFNFIWQLTLPKATLFLENPFIFCLWEMNVL